MRNFTRLYITHFFAWSRFFRVLCGFVFLAWLIGFSANALFAFNIDTTRALRLGLFLLGLGIVIPVITAKLLPHMFEAEE